MEIQPLDSILAELKSSNWLEAGHAIRKLLPHEEAATVALPLLFELTFHEKSPVRSDSCALIKRLGKDAVPFLRNRAIDERPSHRAMALGLLMETGFRHATSTRLVDQLLESRRDDLPDWGTDPEEIIALFKAGLADASLDVRYIAAYALEEFGRHVADTIPVFIEVLQSGTLHQQNWAALHLGRIGPSAVAASDALMEIERQCRHAGLAAGNALKRISCTD